MLSGIGRLGYVVRAAVVDSVARAAAGVARRGIGAARVSPAPQPIQLIETTVSVRIISGTEITVNLPSNSTVFDLKRALLSELNDGQYFKLSYGGEVLKDSQCIAAFTGTLDLVKISVGGTLLLVDINDRAKCTRLFEKGGWLFSNFLQGQLNYEKLQEMGLGDNDINQLSIEELKKAIIDFEKELTTTIQCKINNINSAQIKLSLIGNDFTLGQLCKVMTMLKKQGKFDKIIELALSIKDQSFIPEFIRLFTQLQEIYLVDCDNLTDVGGLARCGELQVISLNPCDTLTDVSVLVQCLQLRLLYLNGFIQD
jgi:hypothetical protein